MGSSGFDDGDDNDSGEHRDSGDRSEGEASVAATEQFDYQSDSDGAGADDGVFQLDVGVPRYSPSYLSVKALVVVGSNQETDHCPKGIVFLLVEPAVATGRVFPLLYIIQV